MGKSVDNQKSPFIIMRQRWSELLFLHWEVDADQIQKLLPGELIVDTYHGKAYVGLVPFSMTNVKLNHLPVFPGLSDFLECNVRTYVRQKDGSTPGIWFFSLDAANPIMAAAARASYSLPYFYANMSMTQSRSQNEGIWEKMVSYESKRVVLSDNPPSCKIGYLISSGMVKQAEFGSIEEFLLERYWLYTSINNKLFWARVHHAPYQIENAKLVSLEESLIEAAGIEALSSEPLVHYSREIIAEIEPLLAVKNVAPSYSQLVHSPA